MKHFLENADNESDALCFLSAVYKVVHKNNAYSGKNADNESDALLFFDDVYTISTRGKMLQARTS